MDIAPRDSPEEFTNASFSGAPDGSDDRVLRVLSVDCVVELVAEENLGLDNDEIVGTVNSSVDLVDAEPENENTEKERDEDFVPSTYPPNRNEEEDLDSYNIGDSGRLFDSVREHMILVGQAISMKVLPDVYQKVVQILQYCCFAY